MTDKGIEVTGCFRERDGIERQDPRLVDSETYKSIPFTFQLGFLTLSVECAVIEKIKAHCLQNSTIEVNRRASGICFGQKYNKHIKIEDCFELEYDAEKIIYTDGSFYKTDLEFLGIYSNGNIPNETDVSILKKLSQTLNRSIFLVKFDWSKELNKLSTVIFENVFEIWNEKLLSVQIRRSPYGGLMNTKLGNCDFEDFKNKFYLTFDDQSIVMAGRCELNITDYQMSELKERRENLNICQKMEKYRHVLCKLAEDEGWSISNFLGYDAQKNYPKIAEELCLKANVELIFDFGIPINREAEITCYIQCLDVATFGFHSSIAESHRLAAKSFLLFVTTKDSMVRKTYGLEEFYQMVKEEMILKSSKKSRL